ncbi:MAG: hypothetical protein A3I77_07625 [Gammaproteobacteria bacterium RIFCSPLOWO2_02_FULL_42_14]|nr:MAG: hypothetical protein A3B71_03455 [Gammaproteobacteria bacterium RIFCSPHIGHO2_02_FULL_42_43]OGT27445.1 MAG: hypothetical protein A2624_06340 [Gammaproteobacteria bacterium RIFCSPHIGHO2_01_FULL_42_8]OGT53013.1 MAG: hypothetical protein A3E54_08070 [Gammaproteobacteria bacterium RIFCSPHIGHO2_12_FULL_41_25]OGT61215.1 MAG: hypothetical protein A3I77_07625 [Gammaproteobacteria bacterium RIFCSPLOWO2_02_FULL_42_14]OGT87142.1 MAG: hypothetical protein A3G86_01345 [Gammaproteobacteria bacterium R
MRDTDIHDSLLFFARALFVTYFSLLFMRNVAWYFFNLPTRDQTKTTRNCYDWFEHYLPPIKHKIDYSEGLFDFEEKGMTLETATENKYRYIFELLELKPGMSLLDVGCGSGVWMEYCAQQGVKVIGLTLSLEQVSVVRKKGLEVMQQDYRVKNPSFIGQFDRITTLGSTEHLCSSMGVFSNNAARLRSQKTIANVWRLFQSYLKPDGKIFVTTLTWNEKVPWSLLDRTQAFVLDQHHGGYYPHLSDLKNKVAPDAGLKMTHIEDHTADYHWSSMVDKRHFGYFTIDWDENTVDKIRYIFTSFLKGPFQFPFHWLYQVFDTWMWQFGGPKNRSLVPEEVEHVAHAQLKYFLLQPAQLLQ